MHTSDLLLSRSPGLPRPWPGLHRWTSFPARFVCSDRSGKRRGGAAKVEVKRKDNVWSAENAMADAREREEKGRWARRRRRGRRVRSGGGRKDKDARVLVSGAMLVEVETVLQTQEPVIKPAWNTFASSLSGIWKGVGAVFSPLTAEMEPIALGKHRENLYDCYTLLHIKKVSSSSDGNGSQIQRKINWVHFNPFGELQQLLRSHNVNGREEDGDGSTDEELSHNSKTPSLRSYGSFELRTSEILEEDVMNVEPGLVFFEDGSYSRGPLEIPLGDFDESKYYLSPTFKFEQCLVKGCHRRLRIIHTIEFSQGGSDIQVIRVAVYEEQWVSPSNINVESDTDFDLKPFSQRKRVQPAELTGSWKVFEMSATPIFGEETTVNDGKLPYVYLCTETLKKRNVPENLVYFGEEETLDMQDVTMLWLPGGITGYVDVKKDGVLCIGVGWYSDEGINLVMERDYGPDGALKEVRCKSEVKRRWSDPVSL